MSYESISGSRGQHGEGAETARIRLPSRSQHRIFPLEFQVSVLFHYLTTNPDWHNEVELYMRDRNKQRHEAFRYRNYNPAAGFYPPNFTLRLLLEALNPDRILLIMRFLVLERKVLLLSEDFRNNAVLIESLLSLLYPLYGVSPVTPV